MHHCDKQIYDDGKDKVCGGEMEEKEKQSCSSIVQRHGTGDVTEVRKRPI